MKNICLLFCIWISTSLLSAQCFEPDGTIWENTWASCTTTPNPKAEYGPSHWIQYDFGSIRKLSKTWVWNTNDPAELDRGFRDVHIDYSLDGEEWIYWGAMEFPQAEGQAVYGGFPGPNMIGLEARYVLITATSNYGDASCAGLAEVKFNLLPNPISNPNGNFPEECPPVTNVEVTIIEDSTVMLNWEPAEESGEYLIDYRIVGTNTWSTIEGDYNEAYLTELTPLETYEYRITTVCLTELSEATTGTFVLDGEVTNECPEVEQVIIQWIGDTEAFIWWEIEEEGEFELRFSYFPEGNENARLEISVDEPEILLEDLQPNTSYEFWLTVICEEESRNSTSYFFTTRSAGEEDCEAIEELYLDELGATTANLSWEPTIEGLAYTVAYSQADSDEWSTLETDQLNISLTNLLPETEYLFRVGSPCGEEILWSEALFFITASLVSTSKEVVSATKVKIFPNPTRGLVAIEYWGSETGPVQYQLISPLGQIVQHGQWNYPGEQQQFRLDLSGLSDGVYHLQLTKASTKFRQTERIVKIE